MTRKSIFSILFLTLFAVNASASALVGAVDERPKVSIVALQVTLDGQTRHDVAQSIADSLSATLIETKSYRVYQVRATPSSPRKTNRDQNYGAVVPEKLPLPTPAVTLGEYVYSFNVLGEDNTYRLTIKKEVASTAEVLHVEETKASGDLEVLFAMVPTTLRQLEAKTRRQSSAFPRSQSPAQAREIIRPAIAVTYPAEARESPGLREFFEAQNRVPPEFGRMNLKDVPKALTYQPMGAIQFINDAWKFCIIQPTAGHRFAVNQNLDVLYDEDGKPYGSLKVDALDSGKIVAGFGRTPYHHPLFKGDVVYGWAPPLK
ncbi:MAG: hypothetical protein JNJ83_20660 [Verrucomicrobiaceae bacterium]|nr:hypothetical protein [Verrucomicrobiaceae bacterium]